MDGTLTIQPALFNTAITSTNPSNAGDFSKKFVRRTNTLDGQVNYKAIDSNNTKVTQESKELNSSVSRKPFMNITEMSSIDMEPSSRGRTDSNLTNRGELEIPADQQLVSFAKIRNSDPIRSNNQQPQESRLNSPTKKQENDLTKYKFGTTLAIQEMKRQGTMGGTGVESPDRSKPNPQEVMDDLNFGVASASNSGSPQPTVQKRKAAVDNSGTGGTSRTGNYNSTKDRDTHQKPTPIIIIERTAGFPSDREGSPSLEEGSVTQSDFGELVKFKPVVKDAKCRLKNESGNRTPLKGSEMVAFTMLKSKRASQTNKNYFLGPTHHSFTGLRSKDLFSMSSGYIHAPTHRTVKDSTHLLMKEPTPQLTAYTQDMQKHRTIRGFGKKRGSSPELPSARREGPAINQLGKPNKIAKVDLATKELETLEESRDAIKIKSGRQDRRVSILSAHTNPSIVKLPSDSMPTVKVRGKSPSSSILIGRDWNSHARLASEEIKGLNLAPGRISARHQAGCQGFITQKETGGSGANRPYFCDCGSDSTKNLTLKSRYLILSPKQSHNNNVISSFRYPISHNCNIDESSVHHPDYFGVLKY
jgi:hypothetical protein